MNSMSEAKKRINRRELGKIALASAAAFDAALSAPAQTAARKYASALDGVEDRVNMAAFDPVLFTKKRCRCAAPHVSGADPRRGRTVAEDAACQDCRTAGPAAG